LRRIGAGASIRRVMARPRSDSPPLFDLEDIRPDFSIERRAMKRGQWPVAGLDEAGRGPLAGPVVAAAVILDPKRIPKGLDDSKRLTPEERENLFEVILKKALAISFASCSAETIDRTDIRKASLEAMRRAAHGLALKPALAITDGLDVPGGLPCPGEAYVKGDRRSHSIAAASIVAKVMRDRMMGHCGSRHISYGFEFHMGYATERHRAAIEAAGACARLHRLSFSPFRIEAEVMVEEEIALIV
jgi:ribonuclease HII